MRSLARSAALAALPALVLTSCGLAVLASPALAPEVANAPTTGVTPLAAPAAAAALSKIAAPQPAVAVKPTPAAADLADAKHIWQTLNNCGPASVVMTLSSLGVDADQETARLALRGPDVRRGMSPVGVDPWVQREFGLRAVWRNDGTNALIKALVANGFAPMVTQWMEDPSISRIAHWRTIVGYDDASGVFYTNDPMRGRHVALTYQWFDRNWRSFSYRYLVIYRPQDEPLVQAIVGADWSERAMRQHYYERASAEAAQRNDSASWLALGEAAYQNGMFPEAVAAFQRGLTLGSGDGVYTLRSSYSQALRALGRTGEAAAVQRRFAGSAHASSTVAPPPDSFALLLANERARPDEARLTE
ncbi:MAG: C39 family peptidase [Chloroflexota bacterium]|nr:C39 family peptidase [Chloroflexota bacterium]